MPILIHNAQKDRQWQPTNHSKITRIGKNFPQYNNVELQLYKRNKSEVFAPQNQILIQH